MLSSTSSSLSSVRLAAHNAWRFYSTEKVALTCIAALIPEVILEPSSRHYIGPRAKLFTGPLYLQKQSIFSRRWPIYTLSTCLYTRLTKQISTYRVRVLSVVSSTDFAQTRSNGLRIKTCHFIYDLLDIIAEVMK